MSRLHANAHTYATQYSSTGVINICVYNTIKLYDVLYAFQHIYRPKAK